MAASNQVPSRHGFPAKTLGSQVVGGLELAGKTAIVTGGYSGIGLETVRVLAGKGVKVVVPVRSPEKAAQALADIAGEVIMAPLDLGDLASVRSFSKTMLESLDRLDLLINNAGIMACPETRVGPGWEAQFGVNHMGHFALTQALFPLLQKTADARVVTLSSTGHKISDIRWGDLNFGNKYDKWQAYGQAKTANALFANALARKLAPTGGLSFAVHPGGIFTPLQRHLPKEEMVALGWIGEDGEPSQMAKDGFKTPEQGCSTTLWAATTPGLEALSGVYCEDCNVAALTDPNSPFARFRGVEPYACNDEAAERLWAVSERLLATA